MKNVIFKAGLVLCMILAVAIQGANAIDLTKKKAIRVLMVGGGSSHDFDRWYKQEDVATLQKDGLAIVEYTSNPSEIVAKLANSDVLFLTTNQPIPDAETRNAIFEFVNKGKGLVLAHPALWYNWSDWSEYNSKLVGGGSKGHDKYGAFDITITNTKHPVTKGVPAKFNLKDELYYYKADPAGTPIEILGTANVEGSEKVFPNIFVVKHPKTRIVGIALGHDAASHEIEPYKTLIRNAVKWVAGKK